MAANEAGTTWIKKKAEMSVSSAKAFCCLQFKVDAKRLYSRPRVHCLDIWALALA